MKSYFLEYTEEARSDLRKLAYVISEHYKAPLTAVRYLNRIDREILKLSHSAESFMIQTSESLQQYGPFPRRMNYKNIAIIYKVIHDVVYIRRVMPSNLIADF